MRTVSLLRKLTGGPTDPSQTSKLFLEELPQRILLASPTPEQQDFGLYMIFTRDLLKMDRKTLAEKATLEPEEISFAEKGLLRTEELTAEFRTKIEQALGFSYEKFQMLPEQKKSEIRKGWGPRPILSTE